MAGFGCRDMEWEERKKKKKTLSVGNIRSFLGNVECDSERRKRWVNAPSPINVMVMGGAARTPTPHFQHTPRFPVSISMSQHITVEPQRYFRILVLPIRRDGKVLSVPPWLLPG